MTDFEPKETYISISRLKHEANKSPGTEMMSMKSRKSRESIKIYSQILRDKTYKDLRRSSISGSRKTGRKRFNQRKVGGGMVKGKKDILKKVFQFYTSFGERTNLKNMRSNKFHKLVHDAKIPINKTSLDILFVAENKHRPNMKFETFLNMLPKIALMMNYEECEDIREMVELLINNHFVPLYELIMEDTFFGSLKTMVESETEFEEVEQIYGGLKTLLAIYRDSFSQEFYKEDDYSEFKLLEKISLKEFNSFCRKYEIVPQYISRGISKNLWNQLLSTELDWIQQQLSGGIPFEDYGYLFTFSRFIYFLICVNRIILLKKTKNSFVGQGQSVGQSLLILLNHVQHSRGFKKNQAKLSVSSSANALVSAKSLRSLRSTLLIGGEGSKIGRDLGGGRDTYIQIMTHDNELDSLMGSRDNFMDQDKPTINQFASQERLHRQEPEIDTEMLINQEVETRSNFNESRRDTNIARHSTVSKLSKNSKNLKSLSRNATLRGNLVFEQDVVSLFEHYAEQLNKIFVAYSSIGEPTNSTKMKSIKFHRLLKDCGILRRTNSISAKPKKRLRGRPEAFKGVPIEIAVSSVESKPINQPRRMLSVVDADFIFVCLTGTKFRKEMKRRRNRRTMSLGKNSFLTNSKSQTVLFNPPKSNSKRTNSKGLINDKLEFETFLKAIEMIALKMYPDLDLPDSVKILLENRILNLLTEPVVEFRSNGLHHISILKELLSNSSIVRILGVLHENIQVYFRHYSDSKNLMNFGHFFRFYKDFEIFPTLISKSKLSNFFYALASLNEQNGGNGKSNKFFASEQTDREVLDSHLFVESIALVSVFISADSSSTHEEMIIFGIQRLDNSRGASKIIKKVGSTRGADGFNWSLMTGLQKYRKKMLESIRSKSMGKASLIKQLTFDSIYS